MRADSGRLVWARDRRAGRQLLGAEGDVLLLLTAERVQGWTFSPARSCGPASCPPALRPRAVAGDAVYVPVRTGIWRAKCADGSEERLLPVKDATHSGNLSAVRTEVGTAVLTCSETHLNVYYDRAAALAALAGRAGSAREPAERAAAELSQAEVLSAAPESDARRIEALCRSALQNSPEDARRAGVPLRRIAARGCWPPSARGRAGQRRRPSGRGAGRLGGGRRRRRGRLAGVGRRAGRKDPRARETLPLAEAVASYQELIERARTSRWRPSRGWS